MNGVAEELSNGGIRNVFLSIPWVFNHNSKDQYSFPLKHRWTRVTQILLSQLVVCVMARRRTPEKTYTVAKPPKIMLQRTRLDYRFCPPKPKVYRLVEDTGRECDLCGTSQTTQWRYGMNSKLILLFLFTAQFSDIHRYERDASHVQRMWDTI